MDAQRLRNLTTGRLHTEIGCVYQDLEFITGMSGIMTHQIPNIIHAAEPWLKEHVKDQAFWDDKHRPDHVGEYPLEPMNEAERAEFISRYEALPPPFYRELP